MDDLHARYRDLPAVLASSKRCNPTSRRTWMISERARKAKRSPRQRQAADETHRAGAARLPEYAETLKALTGNDEKKDEAR
jgi:hypothetical protein